MNGQSNYERAWTVKAMEHLVRCVNCEDYMDSWFMCGVADGDIKKDTTLDEIIEMGYCEDKTYEELLTIFLKIMYRAGGDGGLYSDGIVSGQRHIEWR